MAELQSAAVPLSDQVECVERELKYRKRVYARRVEGKAMTQAQADKELGRMAAVLETLRKVRAGELLL